MLSPPRSVYSSSSDPPDDLLLNGADEMNIVDKGETLHPLFCVSVHEHAWMSAGYGVWGKEEYLKRFWSCLDWELVAKAYGAFNPEKMH
jgi:superoxide dismutase, Fe-Mn family